MWIIKRVIFRKENAPSLGHFNTKRSLSGEQMLLFMELVKVLNVTPFYPEFAGVSVKKFGDEIEVLQEFNRRGNGYFVVT